MSPSKQKANERQSARDRKASARQVASGGTGTSAYNPISGTFHTLEPVSSDTGAGAGYFNGRFKSIDDVDDNASSNGGGAELECTSNNGSYSGESEDQMHTNGKEKHGAGKLESQSGVVGGADKRDKVRGKNERKHQRQKERRAQELKDKCTGYLMSRKLEALSQQLVAMGFSQERATMALIFNDGHVEQSVSWLLEGGEGQVHEDWNTGGNPKIDISEELGHILEIEKKYQYSRLDIERAIVSCEGDLGKALECLRAHSLSTSPSHDEEGHKIQGCPQDSLMITKEEPVASLSAMPQGPGVTQSRSNGVLQPAYQVRRDERFTTHSTEGRLQVSSINSHAPPNGLTKGSMHSRKLSNPLTDLQSSLSPAERRGYAQGTRLPPVSVKTSPPYVSHYAPVSKTDTGLIFGVRGSDPKLVPVPAKDSVLNPSLREPVTIGQTHPLMRTNSQPTVALSNFPVPSPAFSPSSWSRGFMDMGSPSSVLYANATHGDAGLKGINAAKKSVENLDLGASDMQWHYNPVGSIQSESLASQWNCVGNGLSNESPLAPPSNSATHSRSPSGTSYGLFTGWGARLSHSSVDWSTGPMPNCDYRNIDWSMNASPTTLRGLSSRLNSLTLHEKGSYYWNSEEERRFQRGLGAASFVTESTNGHGVWKVGASGAGVQENISSESGNTTAHEWTSPFAGKDLFNLPQAVPSPSL